MIGLGDADAPPDEFDYLFDFEDDWTHSCRVEKEPADPVKEYGGVPEAPVPVGGWGTIPDQYGRKSSED